MLNKDRFFFEPSQLAFWKGVAYTVAYLTALVFSKAEGYEFCFNLLIYCVGCIGEYIELGFFRKEDKIWRIRTMSKCLFLVLIGLIIASLSQIYSLHEDSTEFFLDSTWIRVVSGFYCVLPLMTGIALMFLEDPPPKKIRIKNDTQGKAKRLSKKFAIGYRIKP